MIIVIHFGRLLSRSQKDRLASWLVIITVVSIREKGRALSPLCTFLIIVISIRIALIHFSMELLICDENASVQGNSLASSSSPSLNKNSNDMLQNFLVPGLGKRAKRAIKDVKLKDRYGTKWTKWFSVGGSRELMELLIKSSKVQLCEVSRSTETITVKHKGCLHVLLPHFPKEVEALWDGPVWCIRGQNAPRVVFTKAKIERFDIKWRKCNPRVITMRISVRRLGLDGRDQPCDNDCPLLRKSNSPNSVCNTPTQQPLTTAASRPRPRSSSVFSDSHLPEDFRSPKKRKTTSTMPPGVPHPEAGTVLGPYTKRCDCGGITGIGGTPQGAQRWRSHNGSDKHLRWEFPDSCF